MKNSNNNPNVGHAKANLKNKGDYPLQMRFNPGFEFAPSIMKEAKEWDATMAKEKAETADKDHSLKVVLSKRSRHFEFPKMLWDRVCQLDAIRLKQRLAKENQSTIQ
jgi:hypothetical protein